jgi:mono/diheme cytochrome c family protein
MSFATGMVSGGLPVVSSATASSCSENGHGVHQVVNSNYERKAIMKTTKLAALILTIAVALFILIPSLSWAGDDGATLFKTKCAACHGVDAAGKPAAKIPSLIGDEAKKASDADLEKAITEKPKHAGVAKALTPDQVKMLVSYIRSVQK